MFLRSNTVISRLARGEKVEDAERIFGWNRKPYRDGRLKRLAKRLAVVNHQGYFTSHALTLSHPK